MISTLAPLRSLLYLFIGIGLTFSIGFSFIDVSKSVSANIDRDMSEVEQFLYSNMDEKLDTYENILNVIKILLESTSETITIAPNKSRDILIKTVDKLLASNSQILAISISPHEGKTLWSYQSTDTQQLKSYGCQSLINKCFKEEVEGYSTLLHYHMRKNLFFYSLPILSKRYKSISIYYTIPEFGLRTILNSDFSYALFSSEKDINFFDSAETKLAFGKNVHIFSSQDTEYLVQNFFYDRVSGFPNTFISTKREVAFQVFIVKLLEKIVLSMLIALMVYLSFITVFYRKLHVVESEYKTQQIIKSQNRSIAQHESTLSLINTIPFGIVLVIDDFSIHSLSDAIRPIASINNMLTNDGNQLSRNSFIYNMITNGKLEREIALINEHGEQQIFAFNVIDLKKALPSSYKVQKEISGVRYIITSNNINNEFLLRSELEKKVADQNIELQQLYKKEQADNKSKSVFLSTVSHEMRTPLNGINGAIELIQSANLSDNDRRYFDMIRSSSANLLRLVNDVLDFTKIQSGKLEFVKKRFDIIERVEKVVQGLSLVKKPNVNILIDTLSITKSTVIGDPLRFEQVLNNLLSNALKFTSYGYIKITLSQHEETDKQVRFFLSVKDTGVGIPEEKQNNIFKRFTQASSEVQHSHGGTGLGLAISESLCRLMGGSLELNSKVLMGSDFIASFRFDKPQISTIYSFSSRALYQPFFKGTDFEVILNHSLLNYGYDFNYELTKPSKGTFFVNKKPNRVFDVDGLPQPVIIYSEVPIRVTNGNAHVISTASLSLKEVSNAFDGLNEREVDSLQNEKLASYDFNRLKVLVVDDNETNRIVIRGFLESLNCEVTEASDGEIAIEMNLSFEPQIILMDLQMPNKDGIEATKYIRANHSNEGLRIVALTAAVMAGERERCTEAGMDSFLTKPISVNELIDTLRKFFAHCKQGSLFDEVSDHNSQHKSAIAKSTSTEAATSVNNNLQTWNEDAFAKRLNHSQPLIKKVLQSFHNRWAGKLTELSMSYQESPENVCKAAHAFKGLAGEMQAERLTKCLLNIEKNASKSIINEHDLHLVNEELDALVKQLPHHEK